MRLSATAWRYSPASFSSRRKATTSDVILSGDVAPSDPTVGVAGCCARSERSCGRRDAAAKRDDLATSHVTTPGGPRSAQYEKRYHLDEKRYHLAPWLCAKWIRAVIEPDAGPEAIMGQSRRHRRPFR